MDKILWLIRGVSGSGKSTVAKQLLSLPDSVAYAADDYHTDREGNYNWKVENLGKSHDWCKNEVDHAMFQSTPNIVVHNTSTSAKETKPYLKLAEKYGYKIMSLVVENLHGNDSIHNVPQEVRDNQEKRLRDSLTLQ